MSCPLTIPYPLMFHELSINIQIDIPWAGRLGAWGPTAAARPPGHAKLRAPDRATQRPGDFGASLGFGKDGEQYGGFHKWWYPKWMVYTGNSCING